jgi:hypothetical protein
MHFRNSRLRDVKANTRFLCQDNPLHLLYFPYKVNTIQYFEGGTVQMTIDPLLNQLSGLSTDEVFHDFVFSGFSHLSI